MTTTLYYIYDPMCSWCWAFRPVWDEIQAHLPASISVEYVAGGLAPDTDEPMPMEQQQAIQGYWREIQEALGTEFNFDFWQKNIPRRSTYIACRAVLAAKNQGYEKEMVDAIQRAYYLQALNPSDSDVLMRLAWGLYNQELDIDLDMFANQLNSAATQEQLDSQIALARQLTDQGFPSLVLRHKGEDIAINREYKHYRTALAEILAVAA